MKYTGPIFRPPPEANTLLLQVTVGCSHNSCAFCTMYNDTPFSIESMEQIENDLREARARYAQLNRIYLLNGDPFALRTNKLKAIAEKIIAYFPEMKTITMYASIRNIKHKSDDDLRQLRALRINEIWVGVESGATAVLQHLKKGHTLEEAHEQLARLAEAGIDHNGMYMLGVAGSGNGVQHAVKTAKLINATKPILVGVTTVGFFEGSKLTRDVEEGRFVPATEREILEEERTLIDLIDVENVEFFGDHPINAVAVSGFLPQDKQDMLATLDHILEHSDSKLLNRIIPRSSL